MRKFHLPVFVACSLFTSVAHAHDLGGDPHPHYDRSVRPPNVVLAQASASEGGATAGEKAPRTNRPAQAAAFEVFAPAVTARWDEKFLFIESHGLPAHNMMVGITAWQQQVPLPQSYTGTNAWQIPLQPVPAKEVISIKNRFLRGAIALAANGIPIFNPQNNRGEISQDIGELDEWGGHCGRADDYHYHAAPLHLQSVLGTKLPIAYALDGYPIFGLTEADGSAPKSLDAFNGHATAELGYHYHASNKYPFVNGGFHGEVVERDGQVDPQPHAQPVRPALQALRGARITAFTNAREGHEGTLTYQLHSKTNTISYTDTGAGAWKFQFISADGTRDEQTYQAREGRGGGQGGARPEGERPGGRPPRDERGGPKRADPPREGAAARESASTFAMDALKKPNATFSLTSPEIGADRKLPRDFTGDGSGATPPLSWHGTPSGTQSFALVMDHLAPGNVVKSYWNVWDIPATATSFPKNATGIGKVGVGFRGQAGYEPPHSQGPGEKTYVLTLYALSAPLALTQPAHEVTRDTLLAAMQGKVLASASLPVVYTREGNTDRRK